MKKIKLHCKECDTQFTISSESTNSVCYCCFCAEELLTTDEADEIDYGDEKEYDE